MKLTRWKICLGTVRILERATFLELAVNSKNMYQFCSSLASSSHRFVRSSSFIRTNVASQPWCQQLTWDRKAPGSYGGAPKATFCGLAGELQCEVVLPNNFFKIRDFHLSVFKATKSSAIKDVLPPSAFPLHCGFFACTAGLSIWNKCRHRNYQMSPRNSCWRWEPWAEITWSLKLLHPGESKDLKRALLSKKDGEGPIGAQLLKDNSLLLLANDQTMESAGLLQPEADVMVVFSILRLGSKIRTMGRKLGSNGRP